MRSSSSLEGWRTQVKRWYLEHVLGTAPHVSVLLGDRPREQAPYVQIESLALWEAEPLSRKLLALLRGRWKPSEALIQSRGREAFRRFYFGGDEDAGDHLAIINDWHLRREWNLDSLTDADRDRAQALAALAVLTHRRYEHLKASPLNLQLVIRSPYITDLVYPMVAKTPVLSLQYFLELHVSFTFNAVRHAKHEHADAVISFLYELLFLQQKTAVALLEYADLTTHAHRHKGDAWLLDAEVKAIMAADVLFGYLKASSTRMATNHRIGALAAHRYAVCGPLGGWRATFKLIRPE